MHISCNDVLLHGYMTDYICPGVPDLLHLLSILAEA